MSQTDAAPGAEAPQVQILAQYIKDASFENPNAPATLRAGLSQPQIDVSVDVAVNRIDDGVNEAALRIEAKAIRDDQAVFVVELIYAGLFRFQNIPDNELQPFLLIEAPRLLFPFARNIVSDLVRDGGYPPLMLEPIDFAGLYRQRLAQQAAEMTSPDGNGDANGAA